MKISKNYHIHTYRCGHAYGSDEEIVLGAIDFGLTHMGFSDHVILNKHSQEGIRGNYHLFNDYLISINNLKEKYKDQIDIKIGFEAEYFQEYEQYYRQLLLDNKIDYLILGQHCYIDKNENRIKFYDYSNFNLMALNNYKNDLINGMASGLYSYVAHPDHYMGGYRKWDEHAQKVAHEICLAAVKYNLPLEINLAGVRHFSGPSYGSMGYPYVPFWNIVSQYPIDVVIGLDIHTPRDYVNSGLNVALRIVDENKLNVIQDIKMYKEK